MRSTITTTLSKKIILPHSALVLLYIALLLGFAFLGSLSVHATSNHQQTSTMPTHVITQGCSDTGNTGWTKWRQVCNYHDFQYQMSGITQDQADNKLELNLKAACHRYHSLGFGVTDPVCLTAAESYAGLAGFASFESIQLDQYEEMMQYLDLVRAGLYSGVTPWTTKYIDDFAFAANDYQPVGLVWPSSRMDTLKQMYEASGYSHRIKIMAIYENIAGQFQTTQISGYRYYRESLGSLAGRLDLFWCSYESKYKRNGDSCMPSEEPPCPSCDIR